MRAISPRTLVQLIASLGIAMVVTAYTATFSDAPFIDAPFIDVMTLPGAIFYGLVASLAPWWILRRPLKFERVVLIYVAVMALACIVIFGVRAAAEAAAHGINRDQPLATLGLDLVMLLAFSVFFGGLTSLVFVLPVGKAHQLRERYSRDAPALMMRFVAVGLLGHGLFIYAMLGRPHVTPHAKAVGLVTVALAGLFFVVFTVWAIRWRLWRSRVLAGRDPTWFAVPIGSNTTDLGGVPGLTIRDHDADGVIVRRRAGPPSGAYRTGEDVEPYALVRLPDDLETDRPEAHAAAPGGDSPGEE